LQVLQDLFWQPQRGAGQQGFGQQGFGGHGGGHGGGGGGGQGLGCGQQDFSQLLQLDRQQSAESVNMAAITTATVPTIIFFIFLLKVKIHNALSRTPL